MKKKQIVALVVAVVLFIITGVSSVLVHHYVNGSLVLDLATALRGEQEIDLPNHKYIALVNVVGTIESQTDSNSMFSESQSYRHNTTLEYIEKLMDDKNNRGILLYVDSPGGTVYEAEELSDKLQEYRSYTNRPIWVYMAHYAASGGYYISASADVIYANQNTTTGSIGVIMSGYDLSGLYEKLGIRYVSITSGVNKDSSQLTDEQIAIYQSQVDECYERFVEVVASGRGMDVEKVKTLADGRTYTAKQALENGLIDQISSYEQMQNDMMSELDVYDFYTLPESDSLLSGILGRIEELVPKSEAQILKETAAETESGVLMYYAE